MSFEEKLLYTANILFGDPNGEEDPLVNLATKGFYGGTTKLGRGAKAGLQRLRKNFSSGDLDTIDQASEGPIRYSMSNESQTQDSTESIENWSWLRGVLNNMSQDISAIRGILDHQRELQQDIVSQNQQLVAQNEEDRIENRNKKTQSELIASEKKSDGLKNGLQNFLMSAGMMVGIPMLIYSIKELVEYLKTNGLSGMPTPPAMVFPKTPPGTKVDPEDFFPEKASATGTTPEQSVSRSRPGVNRALRKRLELLKNLRNKGLWEEAGELRKVPIRPSNADKLLEWMTSTKQALNNPATAAPKIPTASNLMRGLTVVSTGMSYNARRESGQSAGIAAGGTASELAGGALAAKIIQPLSRSLTQSSNGMAKAIGFLLGLGFAGAGSYYSGKEYDKMVKKDDNTLNWDGKKASPNEIRQLAEMYRSDFGEEWYKKQVQEANILEKKLTETTTQLGTKTKETTSALEKFTASLSSASNFFTTGKMSASESRDSLSAEDSDAFMKAIAIPETGQKGSIEDPKRFIRTTGGSNSSAYGPQQITKSLALGALKNNWFSSDPEVADWVKSRFIPQGTKFLQADYNSDKKYGKGGQGDLNTPEDRAMYTRMAAILGKKTLENNNGDWMKAAAEWRFGPKVDTDTFVRMDPRYAQSIMNSQSNRNKLTTQASPRQIPNEVTSAKNGAAGDVMGVLQTVLPRLLAANNQTSTISQTNVNGTSDSSKDIQTFRCDPSIQSCFIWK